MSFRHSHHNWPTVPLLHIRELCRTSSLQKFSLSSRVHLSDFQCIGRLCSHIRRARLASSCPRSSSSRSAAPLSCRHLKFHLRGGPVVGKVRLELSRSRLLPCAVRTRMATDNQPQQEAVAFLPFRLRPGAASVLEDPSACVWPEEVRAKLESISRGPAHSQVGSGEALGDAIEDIRAGLGLSEVAMGMRQGLIAFFDQGSEEALTQDFFSSTLPAMARLGLRLPTLLLEQAQGAASESKGGGGEKHDKSMSPGGGNMALQVLRQQQPGFIIMSQELAAAILVGAFLCVYPTEGRGAAGLPTINFARLFCGRHWMVTEGATLEPSQVAKVRCLLNYFSRVTRQMPEGTISFERKVLPLPNAAAKGGKAAAAKADAAVELGDAGSTSGSRPEGENGPGLPSYPDAQFWSQSDRLLCPFQVAVGTIEDDGPGCLEVDFADSYFGGRVLYTGNVQEEIRFVVNPELVVGMLFMPPMADNEAIEIVGAERFSRYRGYARSLAFAGDVQDTTPRDSLGRRQTRIVAIDALCKPGSDQYQEKSMLRETNKAFCGFLNHATARGFPEAAPPSATAREQASSLDSGKGEANGGSPLRYTGGVATGNWGCGAFGGNLQLKSLLQWMAASQAGRPFVLYYPFGDANAARLQEITAWVSREGWTVGDLWAAVCEYGQSQVQSKESRGIFEWILPVQHLSSA
eukprot:TRINITY_DN827_c0_g1_i5.p1 TRINITY_DN827_c0_g1~~TRINITY_DN827_c0_g1_i5.p1  ORF type:complete len:690 (+),score=111.14 TRINITY_DN827_c0_g1_i5:52-2121(+)